MSEAVKVALIAAGSAAFTALLSLIGQIMINKKNREKRKSESEEEAKKKAVEAALKEKELYDTLAEMRKSIAEHNSYASMLSEVKESIVNMDKNIAVMQNDITTLKERKIA